MTSENPRENLPYPYHPGQPGFKWSDWLKYNAWEADWLLPDFTGLPLDPPVTPPRLLVEEEDRPIPEPPAKKRRVSIRRKRGVPPKKLTDYYVD